MKKTGVLFWNSSMAFFILVSWKILCMKSQLFLSSRKEIPVNWRTIVQYHYCRRFINYLRLWSENWTMNTQYGFRSGRSTGHAIFLARRLQSFAEATGKNISIILLDWEKAFDRLDHNRLIESLQRVEVPQRLLQLIKDIYSRPKFRVSCGEGSSAFYCQETGIRQGCPLSP